jgi:hypothetical protein
MKRTALQDIKMDLRVNSTGYLRGINVEMTKGPVTMGVVNNYLSVEFWKKYRDWVKPTTITQREFTRLFSFQRGIKNGN